MPLATAGEESTELSRRVLPEECSRAGVQGVHVTVAGPDVHHAIGHRRRRIDADPPSRTSRAVLRCWRSRRTGYRTYRTRRTPRRWPPPARNRRKPRRVLPEECSRAGVQGVQVTVIGPDVHHAIGHRRRRKDSSPRRVLPQECSGAGVQGVQVPVIGPDVHHAIGHRRRRLDSIPRRVLPQECSRAGVQGVQVIVTGPDVHHAVGHRRRRIDDKLRSRTSTGVLPCWRSRRTRYRHRTRRTPHHWPPPAKNRHRSPVVYFHRSAPVLAFKAYRLPSSGPDVHHAVGHRRRRVDMVTCLVAPV